MPWKRPGCSLILAVFLIPLASILAPALAQDDELDAERPGLIVTYSPATSRDSAPGLTIQRVEFDLSHQWGSGSPDARIPAASFTARWEGLLLIQSPGRHQFHARTDGEITLKVADRVVLSGPADSLKAEPIELKAGLTPIRLEYRHRAGEAHVAIDWEGPGFSREPVPARLYYHETGSPLAADKFEEGRKLADRIGCANCHKLLDMPMHRNQGPPLLDAGRAIDPAWLDAWLRDPSSLRPGTRMPAFGHQFSAPETADLRAYLASVVPKKASALAPETSMALNVATPARGRLLFRSRGCLGCHAHGEPPSPDQTAPDLSDLPRKRSLQWLTTFLGPVKGADLTTTAKHRHNLRLKVDDAAHLASYLVSTDQQAPSPAQPPATQPALLTGDPARGKRLAESARCASCHTIPGLKSLPANLRLTAGTRADAGCLADQPSGPLIPRFSLMDSQRSALRAFIAGLPTAPAPTSQETLAADAYRRLNCVGCHARDGRGGEELGQRIAALLGQDTELGGLKGTLTPPNLTGVGDKLRPEYLGQAVKATAPTARPWLSVQMPSFAFEPGEAEALVAYLQGHDRMQREPDPPHTLTKLDAAATESAAQLIGQRGFGCISCHVLAGRIPPGGEPETLGPDLALAHRRMAERYFHRWIANPQRIIAGTPMPQFIKPIETLPGTLDDQLNQIWQLLASGSLAEVASTGSRESLKRQGDRALVVRDMVLLPDAPETKYIPRGLAIGLKNDHSLLFDADRITWLSWWHDGFMSRTKSGRLWEWHPDGEPLWVTPNRQPPIVFLGGPSSPLLPTEIRERFGRIESLDFEAANVSVSYSLHGPNESRVMVQEQLNPIAGGWERRVKVSNVPDGYTPALLEHPPGGKLIWDVGKSRISLTPSEPITAAKAQLPDDPNAILVPMQSAGPGQFTVSLKLTAKTSP